MKTTSAGSTPSLGRLEQRVANQERRINNGLKSGALTQDEASGLRAKVGELKSKIEADGFDAKSGGAEMNKLLGESSQGIRAAKHNDTIDPAKRMDNIDQRIANGLKDGSLTADEAKTLGDRAGALRQELDAATTPEAKAALTDKLNGLSKDVHIERHDGDMDAGKRTESFNKRIEAGVADGSLTEQEAAKLKEKLGSLDSQSASAVNQLSRSIFHQRHDQQMDVQKFGAGLGSKIDQLGEAGGDLKSQLDGLMSNGGEAQAAKLNILREQIRAISI